MKKILFLISVVLLVHDSALAGGCHIKSVSPGKERASKFLSDRIKEQIKDIEAEYKKDGQELQVVMVARMGESLGGFRLIQDNPDVFLHQYLFDLSKIITNHRKNNSSTSFPEELLSREKLDYSHFGFLVKRFSKQETESEDWSYIIHLLAECTGCRYGSAAIFYEPLSRFFWDTKLFKKNKNKALVVVPTIDIQKQLLLQLESLSSNHTGLLEPRYNVAAVPFYLYSPLQKNPNNHFAQLTDQNSNQWPLETLAAAMRPFGQIKNREMAQQMLYSTNYRPSLVKPVGIKESLACSVTKGPFGAWDATNLINCKDQNFRQFGIYQLITVNSIVNYMNRSNTIAYAHGKKGLFEVIADRDALEILSAESDAEKAQTKINDKEMREEAKKICKK